MSFQKSTETQFRYLRMERRSIKLTSKHNHDIQHTQILTKKICASNRKTSEVFVRDEVQERRASKRNRVSQDKSEQERSNVTHTAAGVVKQSARQQRTVEKDKTSTKEGSSSLQDISAVETNTAHCHTENGTVDQAVIKEEPEDIVLEEHGLIDDIVVKEEPVFHEDDNFVNGENKNVVEEQVAKRYGLRGPSSKKKKKLDDFVYDLFDIDVETVKNRPGSKANINVREVTTSSCDKQWRKIGSSKSRPDKYIEKLKTELRRKRSARGTEAISQDKLKMCGVCGKHFPTVKMLLLHAKSHGEGPYVCEICGVKKTRKEYINVHMLFHTGERPYKCDQCDKDFIYLTNLRQHRRSHTGEKPYECMICKLKFSRLDFVRLHVDRMHNSNRMQMNQRKQPARRMVRNKSKRPLRCARKHEESARKHEESARKHEESARKHEENARKHEECQTGRKNERKSCDKRNKQAIKTRKAQRVPLKRNTSYLKPSNSSDHGPSRVANPSRIHETGKTPKGHAEKQVESGGNMIYVKHDRCPLPEATEKRGCCQLCNMHFNSEKELVEHLQCHLF